MKLFSNSTTIKINPSEVKTDCGFRLAFQQFATKYRLSSGGDFVESFSRWRQAEITLPAAQWASLIRKWLFLQAHTDKFLIVSGEEGLIGERRVAPDDGATEGFVGGFEHVEAADFFVAGG